MTQQHIHCSVSNCRYWADGNKCEANEIMVTSDEVGYTYPDGIDATHAESMFAETPIQSCMQSCCKSFVVKDSDAVNIDGIKKL